MVLQSYGWRMRSLSPAAGLANFEKWLQFQLPFGGWSFFLFFTFFSLSPRLHPWMAPNGVFSQEEKNALLFSLSFLRLLRRFSKFSPPPSSSVPNQTEKGDFFIGVCLPPQDWCQFRFLLLFLFVGSGILQANQGRGICASRRMEFSLGPFFAEPEASAPFFVLFAKRIFSIIKLPSSLTKILRGRTKKPFPLSQGE